MHRAIDAFTDVHPKVLEAKTVFQPIVRLYSGAFVDVVFDYFLANDKNVKSAKECRDFTAHVYQVLNKYEAILPENFRKVLPRMEKDNWRYRYICGEKVSIDDEEEYNNILNYYRERAKELYNENYDKWEKERHKRQLQKLKE